MISDLPAYQARRIPNSTSTATATAPTPGAVAISYYRALSARSLKMASRRLCDVAYWQG